VTSESYKSQKVQQWLAALTTSEVLWNAITGVVAPVTDSDGVRQQRQSIAPIKVVLDQDRLKRSFVGLWTPARSDRLDFRGQPG
jgi:hypothetical protein